MKNPLLLARLRLLESKFSRDMAWSFGSFFLLACSGIIINISITGFRDAAALGVFNLGYAIYIVASQISVWGLHYSVFRHAALNNEAVTERGCMIFTAAIVSLIFGCLASALVFFSEVFFVWVFNSDTAASAISYASFGLIFFPLNKVLLAYLNGMREIKAFSILQGLRYLTLTSTVVLLSASSAPIEQTTLAFFSAELVTAVGATAFLYARKFLASPRFSMNWLRKHLVFGSKGLFSGIFTEVNSRVDVILIGVLSTDRAVGIYSLAAMLADGLYQILALIRLNINPILVKATDNSDWDVMVSLRDKVRKYVLPSMVVASLTIIVIYYFAGTYIFTDKEIVEGVPSLVIILSGICLVSIFVPFDNLMLVSGRAGYQIVQQFVMLIANVVSTALLIPVLGIEGAALGTAISYIFGVGVFIIFCRHNFGWNIIGNTVTKKAR